MLEGLTALPVWSLAISNWIPSAVTGDKNKLSHIESGINSLAVFVAVRIELARLIPILVKWLNASAIDLGSVISVFQYYIADRLIHQ